MYFERFLYDGAGSWPARYRDRFPHLSHWPGTCHLRRRLSRRAGFQNDAGVLIASRTASLVKLAGMMLSRRCRRVLTTDTGWPAWHDRVLHITRAASRRLIRVPLRKDLFQGRLSRQDVISRLADAFVKHGCDGLYLPLVDHLGIRLPVGAAVTEIRRRTDLRLSVVDGSQALGHIPIQLPPDSCDIFLSGCHKWMRAGTPLGLGIFPHESTRKLAMQFTRKLIANRQLTDPLLTFLEQLEYGSLRNHAETVNLHGVFAAAGAVRNTDARESGRLSIADRLRLQLRDADEIADTALDSGWQPIRTGQEFRTGILLLQQSAAHEMTPEHLRHTLQDSGITATTYPSNVVRLSLPPRQLMRAELDTIHRSLRATA